jgi:hypothetical protein
MGERPVQRLIEELAQRLGPDAFAAVCVDLMGGAPRTDHLDALPWLTGHDWAPGQPVHDPTVWKDHWLRSWGARGLLHVWVDPAGRATAAVVAGLGDPEWRPAEMCLKVVAAHDVAGAGDGAARLAGHALPRVRAAAARALAVVGDTEHVAVVRDLGDDPDETVRRSAARALERLGERLP